MHKRKLFLSSLIKQIAAQLKKQGAHVATAESCTGGALATALISVPGSSCHFDRGFITYNNKAKHQMLGVSNHLLKKYGAISEPVAKAMAKGAVKHSQANVAIATTGCAGPGKDEKNTPIGTVWVGICINQKIFAKQAVFNGSRNSINQQAVRWALEYLSNILLKINV